MLSIYEQLNEVYAYLHGLWRYRWSALLIAWLVAIAGWLVVYSLPDQYKAKAAVHMDTSSIMRPLLQGLSVNTNPEEDLTLMTKVLLSRENLLSVMRETDMDLETDSDAAKERLVAGLAKSIKLEYAAPTAKAPVTIFTISYESETAQQAYKVVSTLLNTLIENTLGSGRTDTIQAQEFLEEQIAEYEQRLAEDEARMAEFKKKNVGFMPDEKGDYFNRVRAAQGDIDATKSALRLEQQRYTELRKQLSGESQLLDSSSYARSSAAKLRTYNEQLADLLSQFTEEHPDVQALRSKIADLQAGGLGGPDPAGLQEGSESMEYNPVYQELKVQESMARLEVSRLQILLAEKQKKLEELHESIDIIPQVEADLAKLNRDYEVTKQRYRSLVERRESARMAQKVEQNSSEIVFRVVEAPVVPVLPSGPNRPLYLVVVMIMALGAAMGWAILRFMLYPTFVDFKQLQKLMDYPVLGAISLQIGAAQKRSRRLHLTSFLLALTTMFAVFGTVVFYQQQWSGQVRTLMSGLGL